MPRSNISIADGVLAAITDEEEAELARGIRAARISYEGSQNDDWLCCILQHGISPRGLGERQQEVTAGDLLDTCVDLASLMQAPDWRRALGVFGRHRDRVALVFLAEAAGEIPPDPPVSQHPEIDEFDVGAAVFAALTDAELAGLAEGIRCARLSYHDENDQGDDWLCIMMQHYTEPQGLMVRKRRVTRADLLLTCVDLAELRLTAGLRWGRITNVFQEHSGRVERLYTAAGQGMIPARPALVREARRLADKSRMF